MTTVHEIADQIEDRLADTRAALDVARAALREVEVEEKALASALRALRPDAVMVARPEKPEPKAAPKQERAQVSEALLERVRSIVEAHPEPVTVREVTAEAGGVSSSAIGLALNELRSRRQIRLAGKRSTPGSPSLFGSLNGSDA